MAATVNATLSPGAVRVLAALERFGFSSAFFLLAIHQALSFRAALDSLAGDLSAPSSPGLVAPTLVWHGLLVAFNLVSGLFLLTSRAPQRPPRTWTEVLVPIAGTFLALGWNSLQHLPAAARAPLLPTEMRPAAAGVALALSIAGYAVSTWSLAYLGRSLAIYVAVRKVVLQGPYRFVRHPMYLGYALEQLGLLWASATLGGLLLVAGTLTLLVWRARMEEQAIAEHSAAYRELLPHTGFLLPRWPPLSKRRARQRSEPDTEA